MNFSPRLTHLLLLGPAAALACGDSGGRATDSDTAGPTSLPTSVSATVPTTGDSNSDSNSDSDTTVATDTTVGISDSADSDTTVGTVTDPTSTSGPTSGPTSESDSQTSMMVETQGTTDNTTTGDPPCAPNTCSEDLKSVECDGQPVEFCDNGHYCVDAACVPLSPCEAAELLKGSEGCNFWAVKTQLISAAQGSCFAAFVANTSNEPVHIEVEYNNQMLNTASFTRIPSGQGNNIVYGPYDANMGLPVGEVAILFLSRGPGGFPNCPVPGGGIAQETHVTGTGSGQAFRISTDQPVAAYQMLPYGGGSVAATSATLLLPTSVWDTNYVAVNAFTKSQAVADANPLLVLVADEDGTEITIEPKVAIVGGGGIQGSPAGVPIQYNLNRGQTLQLAQAQELTGSPIIANKRIGFFGGASCLNVPVNALYCDGAHQQIPPVKAMGSRYVAVRYRNRTGQEESPPWRVVGMVDGTQLTWSPAKPAGAPDTLALGQVAEFNSGGNFIVESQDADHPFYLASYMTGGATYNSTGDPEWVNVVPDAQYLDKYVFFTDPTYSETSLVVVRTKKDGQFAPVNLECAGELGNWQALGNDYEFTRLDLVTGNFQNVGNCSNGRHEMNSANPFGVTVWGWGSPASQGFNTVYVSYAYPAGAAIKAINEVEIIPQ